MDKDKETWEQTMKHTEAELQVEVVKYLRDHCVPVFAVRNERNEGMADAVRSEKMGRAKGAPDLIAGKGGKSYWLELKTKTGKQSPEQECFEFLAPSFGARYLIVRSIQDVEEIIYGNS